MPRIFFVREQVEIEIPSGTTILEAERRAGFTPDVPCGGAGKCGKCLVCIDGEMVKACQKKAEQDLKVDTLVSAKKHRILTESFFRETAWLPQLVMHKITLSKAAVGEKRSDWERLVEKLNAAVCGKDGESAVKPASEKERSDGQSAKTPQKAGVETVCFSPDLTLASTLYELQKETEEWYVIHTAREILELRQKPGRFYFAAFDIGTTTVAGYLLDAANGRTLAVESGMNPQAQYGADVIMRANYALENGGEALSACIRGKINEMLQKLCEKAEAAVKDVFQISIVGNTCMHHLFLGISPASLVHAPYTPAFSERITVKAADYGIFIHPKGELLMLPDIAGYVGADTCGCLLAVRPDLKEEITLMLDIGTNGEMVLGNRERLVTCSTAAGPAFEGAKIECGMRGAAGAVDHVSFKNGKFSYTTVEGQPAVGLCGSGLIDLVACLLTAGYIDDGGRLESGQEDPQTFVLVPAEKSGNGKGVYLTQKDVREVQLAKAAIAAGVRLLMQELSVTEKDISCLYIAGAFGNYMDPKSAGIIGMFPRELTKKVKPIGNAAGEGARIALVNKEELREMDKLVKRIDFVELASSPDFQDCFVEELGFEND